MKRKSNGRSPVCTLCSALGTALLMVLILLCIPFTLPGFMGYKAYTVVSGSMEPGIPTGSLVYIKDMEPEDVETGHVIAYYGGRDTNVIITHRVVENRVTKGEFITKGDANRTEDMNPVSYDHFLGRVELSIPKLGVAAQIMTGREGKTAAVCVIGLAIVLHMIAAVLGREKS